MPSLLIGAQSGGVRLVSGNPYSGASIPFHGVFLRLAAAISGYAYVGFSGGITIGSGGGLSSGGLADGIEIGAGGERYVGTPGGGLEDVYLTCLTTLSGTLRMFWQPY